MTKQKKTGAKAEPSPKAAGSKNPSNAAKNAGYTPSKTTPKKKK